MVSLIVRQHEIETDPLKRAESVERDLFGYAQTLDAWAGEVASTMLQRADAADLQVWMRTGEELSLDAKRIMKSSVGQAFKSLQEEQVELIKSIPLEAARKAHEIAATAMSEGVRYADISDRIEALGAATESRAVCIARTETARARSNFTEARSRAVGSTHYIWHTVGDGSVRDCHGRLDGTVQAWSSPPIADDRTKARAHPGCIYNCRCWAEPLFPKSEYDE